MSKRNKDLFHLLEERERGVRSPTAPSAQPTSPRPRRAAPAAGPSLVDGMRRWFQGVQSKSGSGRSASPSSGSPRRSPDAPIAPAGLIMAAVALLCLGVGFTLGRFLPRAAAAELNRPEVAGPRRPGPIEAPKGALSPEKEVEELSTSAFALLRFRASQRDEAGRAAEYLRAHGVETARIRLLVTTKSKSELWVVLAYVPSREAVGSVLTKLRTVPASSAWPELRTKIDKLQPTDLLPL